MRVLPALAAALACIAAAVPVAEAQDVVPGQGGFFETPLIEISLNRSEVATQLGDSFSFTSRIRNNSRSTHSGLVAHLNVVGLSEDIYVDPEDWSEDRTRFLPDLAPRETTTVNWNVTAVTGGEAAIYVTALDDGAPPAVSNAMDVRISETKDLNTDGVLPLTLAVPAVIAAMAVVARRRRRA